MSKHHGNSYLGDLTFTLASHWSVFEWRSTFVAAHHQEMNSALVRGQHMFKASPALQVGFLFSGQRAQWYGMGRELMFTLSSFSDSVSTSAAILRDLGATWDLVTKLSLDEAQSRMNQSKVAQPATTALQIDLLHSVGIRPQPIIGYSSGGIAAAYCAGAISHASQNILSSRPRF